MTDAASAKPCKIPGSANSGNTASATTAWSATSEMPALEERVRNYHAYLSALIKEFLSAIEQHNVPGGFKH